jgi:hypothetical protein
MKLLKNSNLFLFGRGRDVNGNTIVKLKFNFPNERGFSIQLGGGALQNTDYLLRGLNDKTLPEYLELMKESDLNTLSKEIISYIEKYGSKKQKSKLVVLQEKQNKYLYEKVIQLNCGYRWDDVETFQTDSTYWIQDEAERKEIKRLPAEYRLLGSVRIIRRKTLR